MLHHHRVRVRREVRLLVKIFAVLMLAFIGMLLFLWILNPANIAPPFRTNSQRPATVAPRGPSLADFVQLVKDIIAAYNSGNPDALVRMRDYMGQGFSAEDFRAKVGMELGISPDAGTELALADAQFLVARGHGFKSWAELVERSSREQ